LHGMACLALAPGGQVAATGMEYGLIVLWDVSCHPRSGTAPPKPLSRQKAAALWKDLASADPAPAYRAMARLLQVAGQEVAVCKAHLRPAPEVDPGTFARLLADLDSQRFAIRRRASRRLEKLGAPVRLPLQKVLQEKPSIEVRPRIELVLKQLHKAMTGSEALRTLRAVRLLEQAKTAQARKLLQTLARGAPGALLTEDAKAALERLESRTAHKR